MQGHSSPQISTHGPLAVDLIGGAGQHRLSTTFPPHLGLVDEPLPPCDHWHLYGLGLSSNPALINLQLLVERRRIGRFEPQLEAVGREDHSPPLLGLSDHCWGCKASVKSLHVVSILKNSIAKPMKFS